LPAGWGSSDREAVLAGIGAIAALHKAVDVCLRRFKRLEISDLGMESVFDNPSTREPDHKEIPISDFVIAHRCLPLRRASLIRSHNLIVSLSLLPARGLEKDFLGAVFP
jgi:hypothetical protein